MFGFGAPNVDVDGLMNTFPALATRDAGAAAAAQACVHDREGISHGESLRRARESRGLTLQQIAQDTKIPLRHLDALERDQFAALPSGIYRRAEVRAYADAVGLDRNAALARFDRALEQAMPPTASSVRAGEPHHPMFARGRTRVLMTAGVAVTTGAITLAMWARQPGEAGIASHAAPVSPPASVVSGSHSANPVPSRRVEPVTVPPVSQEQPRIERLESAPPPSGLEPQLTVITEPVGARVTVDGVGWGITPVTIRHLAPGTKRVRVTRDGYRAEERLIQVEAGGRTTTLRIPIKTQTDGDGPSPDVPAEDDGTGNESRRNF